MQWHRWVGMCLSGLALASALPAQAVPMVGGREALAFDRPESWAMAFMSSTVLFHGAGPRRGERPGTLWLGAELASIPHLSTAQRRVGFDGSKLEDLNKSPVFGRLRVSLALPAEFGVELGWTPPVTIDGATPRSTFGVSLARPLWRSDGWQAGWRIAHQRGDVSGDITCDRRTAAAEPGSAANPYGCRAPSHDRYRMRATGVELSLGRDAAAARIAPYAAFGWQRLHASTRLDALVFGVRDRSELFTDGVLRSLSIGLQAPQGDAWRWHTALSWTPLAVRRAGQREHEDVWSLRLQLERRLR